MFKDLLQVSKEFKIKTSSFEKNIIHKVIQCFRDSEKTQILRTKFLQIYVSYYETLIRALSQNNQFSLNSQQNFLSTFLKNVTKSTVCKLYGQFQQKNALLERKKQIFRKSIIRQIFGLRQFQEQQIVKTIFKILIDIKDKEFSTEETQNLNLFEKKRKGILIKNVVSQTEINQTKQRIQLLVKMIQSKAQINQIFAFCNQIKKFINKPLSYLKFKKINKTFVNKPQFPPIERNFLHLKC